MGLPNEARSTPSAVVYTRNGPHPHAWCTSYTTNGGTHKKNYAPWSRAFRHGKVYFLVKYDFNSYDTWLYESRIDILKMEVSSGVVIYFLNRI